MKKLFYISVVIFSIFLLAGCPGITDIFDPEDETEKSSDATLSGLTVTAGQINYTYNLTEDSLTITVGNTITEITITPVLNDNKASLTINGVNFNTSDNSVTRLLETGMNTFTLIVTAEDGKTTRTYTAGVTRLNTAGIDVTSPVILLEGDNPLFLEINETYVEPGFTATDPEEGDLSGAVTVTGAVDNTSPGMYLLSYDVSDSAGNAAATAVRVVWVWDPAVGDIVPPTITLNGSNKLYTLLNENFTDPGAVVTDNVDADQTISGTGTVNTAATGTYTLRYNAADAAGNNADEVIRTVVVINSLEQPTITPGLGRYESSQTVTITHPIEDARIVYTLENIWDTSGNEWFQDEEAGTAYSGAITISEPKTLIARAFLDGIDSPSFSRADYAIVSSSDTNIIANGDFTYGLNLWSYWAGGADSTEADFSVEDGVFTVSITDGGDDDWNVHSYYRVRFLLEQDEYYQLQFTAWAENEREINVQLQEEGIDNNDDGNAYTNYFNQDVTLTTSPQVYTYTMCMNDIDNPHASLQFGMGIESADVYIDDISLENTTHSMSFLTETDVPDAELRSFLEDETGKTFGQITETDMQTLTALHLRGEDYAVTDLTGLEFCTELDWFLMEDVSIADFSVLSELPKLKDFGIAESMITDFTQISSLTNLETLYLDNNAVDDINSISGMNSLRFLALGENPLDINDLAVITPTNFPYLERLHLDNGWDTEPIDLDTDLDALLSILEDLDNLFELSMDDFFNMNDSQFASLYTRVLAPRIAEWEVLCFTDSWLQNSSLTLLANITGLRELDLFANNITDLTAVTTLTDIVDMGLAENEFTDLTPLQTLYDAGGLQPDGDWDVIELDLEDCYLDISPGSSNKAVVDYLTVRGVDVDYIDGNLTDEDMEISGTSYGWAEDDYYRYELSYHHWAMYYESGDLYMEGDFIEYDNSTNYNMAGFWDSGTYYYQKSNWRDVTGDSFTLDSYSVLDDLDLARADTTLFGTYVNYTDTAVIPPVIILQGDDPLIIPQGSTFDAAADPGALSKDWGEPDEYFDSLDLGDVDTATTGDYIITYTKTDSDGNAAVPVTRTVTVSE